MGSIIPLTFLPPSSPKPLYKKVFLSFPSGLILLCGAENLIKIDGNNLVPIDVFSLDGGNLL